jgi:hypothetical protein
MRTRSLFGLLLAAAATAAVAQQQPNKAADFATGFIDEGIEARQACSGPVQSSPTTWWRAAIDHNGTTPTASDSTFQYYRTAVQYGADNTGVDDSSDSFNLAINGWCIPHS